VGWQTHTARSPSHRERKARIDTLPLTKVSSRSIALVLVVAFVSDDGDAVVRVAVPKALVVMIEVPLDEIMAMLENTDRLALLFKSLLLAQSGHSNRTRVCPLLDQSGQRWILTCDGAGGSPC
jgi:hypothetical protein